MGGGGIGSFHDVDSRACQAVTLAPMSTRALILAALLCGLAILVAFAVQMALA
jgi:hypothetical protein